MTSARQITSSLLLTTAALIVHGVIPPSTRAQTIPQQELAGMEFRLIGPHRGGRSTTVEGVEGQPFTFFMGTSGGGVWKTTDAGTTWTNISDGFLKVASIGAVEVADSDPNVIYVGTGSAGIRGNVSTGRGMYRSTDGGRSWQHRGLDEAGLIARISVHPDDSETLFVAAMGHPFGKNPERGVFRSSDGGASWEHVLAANDSVGAVDLVMDPSNPRILYAGLWRAERKPWTVYDASTDGGVYRTRDGGDSWERVQGGLPQGQTGRIGITISPTDPDRIWAMVNAPDPDGGLWRSDDGGVSWDRINRDRLLRQRHWYYSHVIADPTDENTVYAMNTRLYRSIDGGVSIQGISVPHGDVHDLWINPSDPDVMVVANDGGAQVSLNGGESWSTPLNQPTAELYRVVVDDQFPYRVYGAQQDNSTISVSSRPGGGVTPYGDWYSVGGCESGHIAIDPRDPDIAYAGCYIGEITRIDRSTGDRRPIMIYPALVDGIAPRDLKYRFQWNAPIVFSPHDPDVLYHTSNHVHRTRDGGLTWETISPDLTRNDDSKQSLPGEPLQHDHTSVEVYGTIFSFSESPHARGELWAGSDDGRVHLSRDDGLSWLDVTPPDLPVDGTVNTLQVSPHRPGRVLVAVQRYRMDDWTPYIFVTEDYGASWRRAADGGNGIPADHPVRSVVEDPVRPGLLFAGTEFGLFVSLNDGQQWQPLQLNLPVTPVTDLVVKGADLVVATQGRSFWILDDVSPLRRLSDEILASEPGHLFEPEPAYRRTGGGGGGGLVPGAPSGALVYYRLAPSAEDVTLEIVDERGQSVRSWHSGDTGLSADPGLHRLVWNLTYPGPVVTDDAIVYLGSRSGPTAMPGRYRVRLTVGGWSQERELEVMLDPRMNHVTAADLQEQFDLAVRVRDRMSETHNGLLTLRSARDQSTEAAARATTMSPSDSRLWDDRLATITVPLGGIENELIQTKAEAHQDPINFPPQLNDQFGYLYRYVLGAYGRPGAPSYERLGELESELAGLVLALDEVLDGPLRTFNEQLDEAGLAGVVPLPTRPGRPISE